MKTILTNEPSHLSVMTDKVINSFSKQASFYDQAAHAQKIVSQKLADTIKAQGSFPVYGNIFDIGCGTGLLSKHLVEQFPTHQIYLLDPAAGMLSICKQTLSNQLERTAIETIPPILIGSTIESYLANPEYDKTKYALIASSFTFHWLNDLPSVINELAGRLEIGGQLFFSLPIKGSFPEWQVLCESLKIPFTANHLPNTDDLKASINHENITFDFSEYSIERHFSNALQFFQEIKMLGAQKQGPQSFPKHINIADFRYLLKAWNKQIHQKSSNVFVAEDKYNQTISCTYRIIEGIITRHK